MRQSGILLHPTSLPSRWGIGDLGPAAYQFVDTLIATSQRIWQVLPLGPTGYGDSPYQCFSAFAGNPLLISPDALIDAGLLDPAERDTYPHFDDHGIDYGAVIPAKFALLSRAYHAFGQHTGDLHAEYTAFCAAESRWLPDYALFMALKADHGGITWSSWAPAYAQRDPAALAEARTRLADAIGYQQFLQFMFSRQWRSIRGYANQRGITIIGDAPIFVAYDSADVWAAPELFWLDDTGLPTVVAGVPPDYFSVDGQRWGNPLYRWDAHRAQGYAWWIERIRSNAMLYDLIRLDHFRGFVAYWEVPVAEPTARIGRWVDAPGFELLQALTAALGTLPIIAEDLGLITDDVVRLRDENGLPGMKIMQFAFHGNPAEAFLPHHHIRACVVYTGTHDNDTSRGWYEAATDSERAFLAEYLGKASEHIDPAWDLMRLAWGSVADTAIAPLQDVLDLPNAARMNYPGRLGGNWGWRFRFDELQPHILERLRVMTHTFDRG
ncbi:MAG: 4-alpha-glucanotransferase [Roseiflexaceae bacterium]